MRGIAELEAAIRDKRVMIGVVGLGYVGIPVACLFAEAGFRVVGVDRDAARARSVGEGRFPLHGVEPELPGILARVVADTRLVAGTDMAALRDAAVVIVCVDTPVDADHRPDLGSLRSVCAALGPILPADALVIVESTLAPGTMDGVVRSELERASGRIVGRDLHVGHCPERVMPGKLVANLRTVSRVCGGGSPEVAHVMALLYGHVVKADLDETDCVTAEVVKTAENAYRDVNIAFANEVALVCETVGADVRRVRELVNRSPGRAMLVPGAGVGGHCVPKDPWLLAHAARRGPPVRLIPAARAVNDSMPAHVCGLIERGIATHGLALDDSVVAILGSSYLANSGDTRNSPSLVLRELLDGRASAVRVHDPFVPEHTGDVWRVIDGADAVALMVAHDEYPRLDLHRIRRTMRTPVLIDGRQVFDAVAAAEAGLTYVAVGGAKWPARERPDDRG